jgi:hypothetical protein
MLGYLTLAKAADQPVKGPRFAPLTYEQLNVHQKPILAMAEEGVPAGKEPPFKRGDS